jgi:hypothetical protein|tara:strand:- start:906 stop:1196 length:291 start_codon:yes stop_codon:yes gene_type:complete
VTALRWDGQSKDIVWDASPKAGGSGFGIKMYPNGRKEYVFQRRIRKHEDESGHSIRGVSAEPQIIIIGSIQELSLSDARDQAQALRADSLALQVDL